VARDCEEAVKCLEFGRLRKSLAESLLETSKRLEDLRNSGGLVEAV
jgi:hypothetical protein